MLAEHKGKSLDAVKPATYVLPALSLATAFAWSWLLPAKKVVKLTLGPVAEALMAKHRISAARPRILSRTWLYFITPPHTVSLGNQIEFRAPASDLLHRVHGPEVAASLVNAMRLPGVPAPAQRPGRRSYLSCLRKYM